jgi:hypothetical protein
MRSVARQIQYRRLVLVGFWLFVVSCAFPIAASVLGTGPVWVGRLDVVLAFTVAALARLFSPQHTGRSMTQRGSPAIRCIASSPASRLF